MPKRACIIERQRKPWKLETVTPNVHTIRFEGVHADWEQWILLRSDVHHDNVHCDQAFEKRHLDEARERNALVIDGGDLFCAMQGKYDPRSSMDDLRPEHKRTDYLDALVETATEFYRPYADLFAVLGRGNHETGITKRHGTDLTDALARELRRAGGDVVPGGYGGWARFMFTINHTVRVQLRLKYFHGSAKNPDAQVTRGVIQTNRQAVYLANADVVLNGHSHDAYIVPIQREHLNDAGAVEQRVCWFLRTPGYKDEYSDGFGGFHVEGGKPPKPIGAIWMHLRAEASKKRIVVVPEFTLAMR